MISLKIRISIEYYVKNINGFIRLSICYEARLINPVSAESVWVRGVLQAKND